MAGDHHAGDGAPQPLDPVTLTSWVGAHPLPHLGSAPRAHQPLHTYQLGHQVRKNPFHLQGEGGALLGPPREESRA